VGQPSRTRYRPHVLLTDHRSPCNDATWILHGSRTRTSHLSPTVNCDIAEPRGVYRACSFTTKGTWGWWRKTAACSIGMPKKKPQPSELASRKFPIFSPPSCGGLVGERGKVEENDEVVALNPWLRVWPPANQNETITGVGGK
jgi:hypothetical protein